MTQTNVFETRPRPVLNIALWTVQALLAVFFIYAGYVKLALPFEEIAKMLPWASSYPALVTITGLADLLGGIGILLPAAVRILPRLTVAAAYGLATLQVLALGFHLVRGETMVAPMNVVLIALIGFVLWGRSRALPMTSKR